MNDLVERLRGDLMTPYQATQLMDEAAARIEQLEKALREISGCKTFTDRQYMINIARAALAAPSGAMEERT